MKPIILIIAIIAWVAWLLNKDFNVTARLPENEKSEEQASKAVDAPFLKTPENSKHKRQAGNGMFYLRRSVSVETEHGITGIEPGTLVKLVVNTNDSLRFRCDAKNGVEFDAKPIDVTDDLDEALNIQKAVIAQRSANAKLLKDKETAYRQKLKEADEQQKELIASTISKYTKRADTTVFDAIPTEENKRFVESTRARQAEEKAEREMMAQRRVIDSDISRLNNEKSKAEPGSREAYIIQEQINARRKAYPSR